MLKGYGTLTGLTGARAHQKAQYLHLVQNCASPDSAVYF